MLSHACVSPALHRVHQGSPSKISTPKRVFDMAAREGTSVWKARKVMHQEDLQPGEVFITHRRVLDDKDYTSALAKLGVSESVLVSESLGLLAEDADVWYQSLSGMTDYRDDVQIILSSIKNVQGLQGKGSFCRFAYGVYLGCSQDGKVYNAIMRSGMKLFWEVLGSLAEDHLENTSLQWMSKCQGDDEIIPLRSFARMFHLLHERHQKSHPFSFIGGDVDLAEHALEVLKFLAAETKREKFKEVLRLIHAVVPLAEKRILMKKQQVKEEASQEQLRSDIIEARQPRRRLWE